jgi:NDP-sugar pyrophosphorylase family protein
MEKIIKAINNSVIASKNVLGAINGSAIKTCLLLAAGTGSRLRPSTDNSPKCLTKVGGKPILGRLVENLRSNGIGRLVVVTGYMDHCIHDFLNEHASDFQVDYVFNPLFRTTNNIYSLWLGRSVIQEPFILIESDLVFESSMLQTMLTPGRIAISAILPWMNGTTVQLNTREEVESFHFSRPDNRGPHYKTVNICSLSLPSWGQVITRLDRYISEGRVDEYYEAVFAEMVADRSLVFEAVHFAESRWYEIDTVDDLTSAERMFPLSSPAQTLEFGLPA